MAHPYVDSAGPLAFAHRGAASSHPENTIVAFEAAIAAGVDGLEIDLHPASDGTPVVIHDDTVDRVTGASGRVNAMSVDELRALDAGHTFTADGGRTHPFRGRGVKIPTLEEVLALSPSMRLNADLKESSSRMEDRLATLLEQYRAWDRVLLCSFSDDTAARIRSRFPRVATSAAQREATRLVVASWLGLGRFFVPRVDALQLPARHHGLPVVTPRLVRLAHEHGLKVHVWTVDDPDQMRHLLAFEVDGLVSNRPADLVAVMQQMGLRRPACRAAVG